MKFEEKEEQLQEQLDKVNKRFQCLENAAGQGSEVNAEKIEHLSENFISIQTRFEEITNVMDNVLERLHEFELQRRNNLLFYGVPEEQNESSVKLLGKIREIIRSQFGVQVGFFIIVMLYKNNEVTSAKMSAMSFIHFFIFLLTPLIIIVISATGSGNWCFRVQA